MKKISIWAVDTFTRVYKSTEPGDSQEVHLDLGLSDKGSFQAAFRPEGFAPKLTVKVSAPDGIKVRAREVGYIFLESLNTDTPELEQDGVGKVPGFVPEPLFEIKNGTVQAMPLETGAVWVSVETDNNTKPGSYEIKVDFYVKETSFGTVTCTVEVFPVEITTDKYSRCAHWFYPNCIYEWYGLEPFEEKTWELVRKYMENMWDHGNNIMNTYLWTMPVNGDMGYYQLLKVKKVGENKYLFDWSNVLRWIRMAKEIGFKRFLFGHFFTQWGAANPPRIYENYDDPNDYEGKELWPKDTPNTDPVYEAFLDQLFPELKKLLEAEGIYEGSLFHLSDEPLATEENLKNYRNGRAMVKKLAPWITCIDAINHMEYVDEGMTDIAIAGLQVTNKFRERGLEHYAYFCCGPRGTWLNRLMDTPLTKIRASGWLAYFLNALGILHWGYNSWYKLCTDILINPYAVTHGHDYPMIPHGDCYMVYPGEDGPVDSIRWEIFGESMTDFALLNSLNIDKDSPVFKYNFLEYDKFPKNSEWYKGIRREILEGNIK